MPLADELRPQTINDMVGQQHIIGPGAPLRCMIESNYIPSLVFYGPTGTGKTTLARIIASHTNRKFVFLNAINIGVADIKKIIKDSQKQNILLVIDEMQALNKRQQQSVLDVMENGAISLIANTSANPFFQINQAVLSRSKVVTFHKITSDDAKKGILKAVEQLEKRGPLFKHLLPEHTIQAIANDCDGDMRRAMNTLEMIYHMAIHQVEPLSIDQLASVLQTKGFAYDRDGDEHYNTLSAFHKSLRGSDTNGAMHWLSRLIKAGDLDGIARRLQCVASEDVGFGEPHAITLVDSAVNIAYRLGFPEAQFPLAHATIYLCKCPKSDSITQALGVARYDMENTHIGDIPKHLKDAHYKSADKLGNGVDYKYPHNYINNFVHQQYLPDELIGREYYIPQQTNAEQNMNQYDYWVRQFEDQLKGR